MAVKAITAAIPSNGNTVTIADEDGDTLWGDELALRNTGTVTVLLGGGTADTIFPLNPGETLGLSIAQGDTFAAKVQTAGTAGELTAIKTK